jgi:hypothetical protein
VTLMTIEFGIDVLATGEHETVCRAITLRAADASARGGTMIGTSPASSRAAM